GPFTHGRRDAQPGSRRRFVHCTIHEGAPMTENTSAQLSVDGTTVELGREKATIGNDGLNIGPLLKSTGQVTYDPGFMNTANAKSAITYIDGDEGVLRYRGYPIEQLAENSSFLEVAYLLIYGELP